MTKRFFITTPIYYSNDVPHIGHAYSTLIADIYARFKRLLGYEVKFSTGVDENSQKIVQKAEEAGIEIYEYLDSYAQKHIAVWDALSISYTDFIRTTGRGVKSLARWVDFQYDHHAFVQKILAQVHSKGQDIYQWEYEGLYCVGCEAFKKESDLIEATGQYEEIPTGTQVCPDHPNRILEVIKEKNWFFKLSNYQSVLEKFYRDKPNFVIPERRFAEVKAFVDGGLEDFSISREGKTFGIQLPFDNNSVSYVWFDALLNYVTVCQKDLFWDEHSEKIHVLGKDISRFHAIYWPAMLESAGLPKPDKEIVTGFFTVDGQKMSKSLGNMVNPVEVVEKYGRDALVFYLLYDIPIGTDGDFSWERFHSSYDAILCNSWGNLVNRVVTLCKKNWVVNWSKTASASINSHIDVDWFTWAKDIEMDYLSKAQFKQYLDDWYKTIQKANEYMQTQQPWTKLKDEFKREEGVKDLQFLLWVVKQLTVLSAPILTEGFIKMQRILGNEEIKLLDSSIPEKIGIGQSGWQFESILAMEDFSIDLQPEILYQRVE
jgi:methionyl-tRNA synthetase